MCFVYYQLSNLRGAEVVVLPLIRFVNNKLSSEILSFVILHYALSVCWYAVAPTVVAVNVQLIERTISKTLAIHSIWKEDAPYAITVALKA
jgi:hypothetical protein